MAVLFEVLCLLSAADGCVVRLSPRSCNENVVVYAKSRIDISYGRTKDWWAQLSKPRLAGTAADMYN